MADVKFLKTALFRMLPSRVLFDRNEAVFFFDRQCKPTELNQKERAAFAAQNDMLG